MKNENLIVRCSELHKIMTKSRSKSNPLSETAKSYVMQKAKEDFYGIETVISNKYTEKGIMNKPEGINMVNQVRFMDFRKNEIRLKNEWLTGECDINADERIIDIKCSWSFDTFPAFQEEAEKGVKKAGYDWQLRGYMLLYNKPTAEVIYCLTTTPPSLLGYGDDAEFHNVENIPMENRLTCVKIEKDLEKEKEMLTQYDIANNFYKECIKELETKNKTQLSWI